jgi:LacI family transcriptional regulator
MAATIRDVASKAGVSIASVSRALNGLGNVAAGTNARILAVAAELGYVPSSAARSLVMRRTNTVGAILPDLHGEFFSELIRGIDRAARERGLHLLLSSAHGDGAEAASALKTMSGRVDGLLVMSPHLDAQSLHRNLPRDLPVVLMNTPLEGHAHASFTVDNHGGALAMMRHLSGRGFRDVAFVGGPESNFEARERLRGFCEATSQWFAGARAQILHGDFTEESGWRAGNQILALADRPDAVFCANDAMAIGCLFAFNEAGVDVPGDIALVGFDDIPLARFVNPPLTTVRIRIAELGAFALERLALSIRHPDEVAGTPQALRSELVVRGSCARRGANISAVDATAGR